MKTIGNFALIAILMLSQVPATAGTVQPSIILGNTQMHVRDGRVTACGMRFAAFPKDAASSANVTYMDTSFMMHREGFVLVKGGLVGAKYRNGEFSNTDAKKITNFWLMPDGSPPTKPDEGKLIDAESKNYLLYKISSDYFLTLVRTALDGKKLVMGGRVRGEHLDQIFGGVVNTDEADKQQIIDCVRALADGLDGR